eukprot:scaffold133207_cov66-Phaeocystis_antarctica.AAC.2
MPGSLPGSPATPRARLGGMVPNGPSPTRLQRQRRTGLNRTPKKVWGGASGLATRCANERFPNTLGRSCAVERFATRTTGGTYECRCECLISSWHGSAGRCHVARCASRVAFAAGARRVNVAGARGLLAERPELALRSTCLLRGRSGASSSASLSNEAAACSTWLGCALGTSAALRVLAQPSRRLLAIFVA